MFLFSRNTAAKPTLPQTTATEPVDQSDWRECPICFTRKPDVAPLEHIGGGTALDTSTHCMCSDCCASFDLGSHGCPFCRGKIGGDFIVSAAHREFVDSFVSTLCNQAKSGDQHTHARWLEMWEAFEFEHGNYNSEEGGGKSHEGRPDVVARVAALVMQDARFAPLLEQGIQRAASSSDGNTWLCNGAGVVFRLHGLLASGSLAIAPALSSLLQRAYEAIFAALEKKGWHGAHLGCLYMQALSAWLSACRCGNGDTAADAAMVRRAGTAVAKHASGKMGEVKSHTIETYVRLATSPVWGGADPVLRAAYGVH